MDNVSNWFIAEDLIKRALRGLIWKERRMNAEGLPISFIAQYVTGTLTLTYKTIDKSKVFTPNV